MPNMSYLLTWDDAVIYPSRRMGPDDLDERLLSHDVRCVPLLWLAMFRAADLTRATFTVDADGDDVDPRDVDGTDREVWTVHATAPLAPKRRALAQLTAALPVLHRLFAGNGALDGHAALLAEAVSGAPGEFVTIELEEIAVLHSSTEDYYGVLGAALAGLDGAGDRDADRDRLVELTQLRTDRAFPPARLLFEDEAHDDDLWNHSRLLGTRWSRPVPWESDAATRAP